MWTATTDRALLPSDGRRVDLLGRGRVLAEAERCVQCGVCEYNCPLGVSVRHWIHSAGAVLDPACILCGSCAAHCPRGTLRLEPGP